MGSLGAPQGPACFHSAPAWDAADAGSRTRGTQLSLLPHCACIPLGSRGKDAPSQMWFLHPLERCSMGVGLIPPGSIYHDGRLGLYWRCCGS